MPLDRDVDTRQSLLGEMVERGDVMGVVKRELVGVELGWEVWLRLLG